jgi:hypothetical protein
MRLSLSYTWISHFVIVICSPKTSATLNSTQNDGYVLTFLDQS